MLTAPDHVMPHYHEMARRILTPRRALFQCMECGRKFATVRAAQTASNNGCPKCGGVDIDSAS